jgi:methylenetetrahydrofolate reductase (NADPH)
MVKIIEKIKEADASGGIYIGFEYFPPRTSEGVANLLSRFGRMAAQGPLYGDVTWGAGGSTSDLTLSICETMKRETNMEPNMHLTWYVIVAAGAGFANHWRSLPTACYCADFRVLCSTNMPAEKITIALDGAKKHGIDNIVALRGGECNCGCLAEL